MAAQACEIDVVAKKPCPEMLLGLSLPALVELFDLPLKYLSVAGFEIIMFR